MHSSIIVYADWAGIDGPKRLGLLHSRRTKGSERFEFEYDAQALQNPLLCDQLDPRLGLYPGRQYPVKDFNTFGCFADASPDRWGRLLMKRRHERDVRALAQPPNSKLYESDFLLGVHDTFRVGGLRFKVTEDGPFLDDHHQQAAPPLAMLRELEEASRRFEQGEDISVDGKDWLRMLMAPGGSLGGARPKASVLHPDNSLWIAKFPSNNDKHNVGGWEMVTNILANVCGLRVALGAASKYASDHHCFMVKRFDRTVEGDRLHFASAMTLTEHQDGDDHSTGASYLEIAEVLIRQGSSPNEDLRELWKRILFNMLVSNTDDHLRNHGFILVPGRGWRLSDAYDMNPVPYADGLKLNVTENDNALDLDLVREVATIFRFKPAEADETIETFQERIGSKWRMAAQALQLDSREIDMMAPAFSLTE